MMTDNLREQVRQAMLNFASDYHMYQNTREDIMTKGIESHPYFIDRILNIFKERVNKLTLIDEAKPELDYAYFIAGQQLYHNKKQLLDEID